MNKSKNKNYICNVCEDKGFIETGNNDLPCSCEKGLKNLFNVAGEDFPLSGKELLEQDYLRKRANQDYLD